MNSSCCLVCVFLWCYCFRFGVGEYLLVGVDAPVLPLLLAGLGFVPVDLLELARVDKGGCCCCCCCCLSLDEAAATAAAAGEPVVMAETPPTAAATAVVDEEDRLLLLLLLLLLAVDIVELLLGTPVVVIVGGELGFVVIPADFEVDKLLFERITPEFAWRLPAVAPDVDSFDIESLRGGNRSFTLSSVFASSNDIFFFSPKV